MGYISNIFEIDNLIDYYNSYPIICCIPLETIIEKFQDYKQISLGALLSFELIKFNKDERNTIVEKAIEEILSRVNVSGIIITDIEILFNPDYKLDMLRLFIQLSRNRSLIIQWPGEYDSGSLIYSKPGYEDYKRYAIKDYDVICLK